MSNKAPLTLAQAEGYVRDVLAEMDAQGQGDALRLSLRWVGPLSRTGITGLWRRGSLCGDVGEVRHPRTHMAAGAENSAYPDNLYRWVVCWPGFPAPPAPSERRGGQAETLDAADAALVEALRELGWHCMGAP